MSKSKRNTKKAAQGKARPVAVKSKKTVAPSKSKTKTKQTKAQPAAGRKAPTKKTAVPAKKSGPKKISKKTPPSTSQPALKKPAAKVLPKKQKFVAAAPAKPASKPVASAVKPHLPAKAPAPKPAAASPAKPLETSTAVSKGPAPAVSAKRSAPPAPALVAVAAPPAAPVVVAPVKKGPSQPLPAPGPTKSGALFYDSHMHTPLCKHAWGEPEEYAQQALKAGLKGIIFTCHCPMPNGFWPTVRMSESDFDTYVALVQRAADAFKGRLDIRLGIESEFFPGCEEYIAALHQRADFHYVLGAVHWQAKEYLNKFETGTIENFRRTYFEHLAKSAESGLYDCLAHPDLVKNYHPDSWCFAIVKNTVSAALDRIAATGVAMELNTSGLNKSYSEMNPGLEMLRMMAERKIPIVVGSDSHRPVRVGEHFVTALNHLTEAGYEKVSYFLNRQRIDLQISDVLASLKKAADHNA